MTKLSILNLVPVSPSDSPIELLKQSIVLLESLD